MNLFSRYFRLSLTSECNLSCYFCHNEGQERLFVNRTWLSSEDIVWACEVARSCGFTKFKLTGGEPTIRKDLLDIISGLRTVGIDDLSMITNGTRLKAMASALRSAGLPRLNVSLFTLDPKRFHEQNGGTTKTLRTITEGIDEAIKVGFDDLKINYVWHHRDRLDDFLAVARFAGERSITVVVLPLLDEYGVRTGDERTSLDMVYSVLRGLGIQEEHTTVDGESIRRRLIRLSMGTRVLLRMEELGEVGPYAECVRCPKRGECREGIYPVRLAADGVLRPCLAEGRAPINLYETIKTRDAETLRYSLETGLFGHTQMYSIGRLINA
jgi:cyclic pyranopterin phosphate synthase